jgi:hypothetical protein
MMSEEGGGVIVVLEAPVQHLSLLLIDWCGLLIPEEMWPMLQPQLEKDFSAIRDAGADSGCRSRENGIAQWKSGQTSGSASQRISGRWAWTRSNRCGGRGC